MWCCLAGSFWLNFSRISSSPACHPQYSKVFPYNVTARPGRSCRGPRGHRNTRLLGGFSNTWVFAGALVWAWHFCLWYVAIEYVGVNLRISNFLNQVMVLALLPWISFYINPYETSCHTLCGEWYAGHLLIFRKGSSVWSVTATYHSYHCSNSMQQFYGGIWRLILRLAICYISSVRPGWFQLSFGFWNDGEPTRYHCVDYFPCQFDRKLR